VTYCVRCGALSDDCEEDYKFDRRRCCTECTHIRSDELRDVLTAVRGVLVAVQKELGWIPAQQGYSTKMTTGERDVARAIREIDSMLVFDRSDQLPDVLMEIEPPYEAERVREAIEYLDSIGMGNCADAVRDLAARNERAKVSWVHCDCGARKPTEGSCPVCDGKRDSPCICREYIPAGER